MKSNEQRYEIVDAVPPGALTVKNYAESISISTSHVYKLYNQGKLNIVVYQGVNFVLKNKSKISS